jgi:amicyanin
MKKSLFVVTILSMLFFLSGCGSTSSTNNNSSTKTNSSSSQNQNTTATTSNSVNIQNFAFDPATLTVKKGATVTWTNSDSAAHQIRSATFKSNMLTKGQTFSFTFNTAGTFDYSCSVHPSMTGKIVVE